VEELMRTSGFYDFVGEDHFLDPDEAIGFLFHRVLDPAVCIYECPVRVFGECQNLPKRLHEVHIDWESTELADVPTITAEGLWEKLRVDGSVAVLDVREPREFAQGHIPGARPIPVPDLLESDAPFPRDQPAVLICRSGRRSRRAAAVMKDRGFDNLTVLMGGMLAWERANLLEAVGDDED
jgi:SulP family sulfate permease